MRIEFVHVTKMFGAVQALNDVSLEIRSGEFFFLLGPSGCGKTTLLRTIAGFESVDAGRVLFDGTDVSDVPPHKRNTAMVFQGYALWPHMTVAENVAFGLEVRGETKTERESRVATALRQVQIEELARRKPHELSGGQQQRVALARTLAVEPACLLLDEPLANLDARLRRDMRAEIRRLCKRTGLTAVYVTHDREEALSMADRIAVFDRGQVLQIGSPEDIYRRPADSFVAGFIGETNFVRGRVRGRQAQGFIIETLLGLLNSATGPENAGPGQEVTVSLRPEVFRIITRPPTEASTAVNLIRGTMAESSYLGEMAEHLVRVNDQVTLKVFHLNPREAVAAGEEVLLVVDRADVVVLASRPSSAAESRPLPAH